MEMIHRTQEVPELILIGTFVPGLGRLHLGRGQVHQVALHVEETDVLEKRPEDPLGVYTRTGRVYYGDEG